MRDLVVYLGGFGLPDRTASAMRALGNAAVLRAAGYDVLIAGKLAGSGMAQWQPVMVRGFPCRDIRQPLPGLPRVDYTVSAANVTALVEHSGPERIAAIMAYNYPGFGLQRVLGVGRRFGIPVINESTEWYGWEGFRPVSNARRMLESHWRNNGLVSRAGNFVCATRWSRERHPEINGLVLPFAIDPDWECWKVAPDEKLCAGSDGLRLVYSGSPGLGMHKDRLPLIMAALDRAASRGRRFHFDIVGLTSTEYLRSVPDHAALLGRQADRIRFLGRMSHSDAVGVLKSADISIFVRERNRVSEVGFPTKFAEAVTCGIPVLTNDTSDIAGYLEDGVNGFLLPDCRPDSIEKGLDRVFACSRAELEQMKSRVAANNPFALKVWVPAMQAFMSKLRMPH